jgi:hypothetical protein
MLDNDWQTVDREAFLQVLTAIKLYFSKALRYKLKFFEQKLNFFANEI